MTIVVHSQVKVAWTLAPELRERSLVQNTDVPNEDGEFVLYWAHHALRAHDNPALEAAASIALQLKLPLLVYQGLGGRHRYNSDRHHHFILQCAKDFADDLAGLGLRLVFHLPDDPSEPGPLGALIARSAAVVSELYPVPPFRQWYRKHMDRHAAIPWLLVDASCILPMPHVDRPPTRAFQFRKKFWQDIETRVDRGWKPATEWPSAFTADVGFQPFDLAADFSQAVARCRIDHSVPAVSDTPGGSTAGYARWKAFLDQGLDRYHQRRNDAALPQGVSRLSPYLHYGCVSPLRIAAGAQARGGEGADKFLDELLVWRELSHHFCYRNPVLESLDALPAWARDSLAKHEADPREQTFDWEKLVRGKTGNLLWDLAQRSLLRRGELHNNVRMTWGKAFLPWSQTASRALKLMVDLNHRFALDGNDPNSYGGLLWCLGQFDRAFPPGPVFGKVRQRSIRRHAARIDMGRYAEAVSAPAGNVRLRVAVIGAGMAGLTAARILDDQGHDVVVLDKARGPGGRMSTRRMDGLSFDHGAQYFTARDPRFLRHVYAWRERGLVETWDARIAAVNADGIEKDKGQVKRYVAVPGMSSICSEIAGELPDCRYQCRVESVRRENGQWTILPEDREPLTADALVMALPPRQVQDVLGDARAGKELPRVEMQPCWSVMAVLDRPLLEDHDAAFVNTGPLSWIARQASRPGRPDAEAWVLHATPEWSAEHLEARPGDAQKALLAAAAELPVARRFETRQAVTHRWRFALAKKPLKNGSLGFEDQRLVLAGDWCNGSRVEGAFLSGASAAGRIMAMTHSNT